MTTDERDVNATARWPILFRYKGPVIGTGFVADVELCGRLLVEIEADGLWLYGVNPGAFAVAAPNLAKAGAAVTEALTMTFVDFAEQFPTFDAFKAEIERFFGESDQDSVADWDSAVKAIRSGALPALPGLPIKSADEMNLHVSVTSRTIETLTPDDNRVGHEERPMLAAAA